MSWLAQSGFLAFAALFSIGLYTIIAKRHLVKKLIGLAILQTGAFLLYMNIAAIEGGTAPILEETQRTHMNPLPHVLILTAIVVSVSTLAVGLALCVRIKQEWGSCEADEIARRELQ